MAHRILICKSCENIFPLYLNRAPALKFSCPKCGSSNTHNVFHYFKS